MVSETVLAISTTSLIVELSAFALVLYGYSQKRVKKFRTHGSAMTVAVALHLTVILSWMVFSLYAFVSEAGLDLRSLLIDAALTHVTLGAVAASLGVWLVGRWHLQADIQGCFGRKRLMLPTIILWSAAIALGVFLYAIVVTS